MKPLVDEFSTKNSVFTRGFTCLFTPPAGRVQFPPPVRSASEGPGPRISFAVLQWEPLASGPGMTVSPCRLDDLGVVSPAPEVQSQTLMRGPATVGSRVMPDPT